MYVSLCPSLCVCVSLCVLNARCRPLSLSLSPLAASSAIGAQTRLEFLPCFYIKDTIVFESVTNPVWTESFEGRMSVKSKKILLSI